MMSDLKIRNDIKIKVSRLNVYREKSLKIVIEVVTAPFIVSDSLIFYPPVP